MEITSTPSKNIYPKVCHSQESHLGEGQMKLTACWDCKAVHYCSPKHQSADWNSHKELCRMMRMIHSQSVWDEGLEEKVFSLLEKEIRSGQHFTVDCIIEQMARLCMGVESKKRLFSGPLTNLYKEDHHLFPPIIPSLARIFLLEVSHQYLVTTFSDEMSMTTGYLAPDLSKLSDKEFEDALISEDGEDRVGLLLDMVKMKPKKKEELVSRALAELEEVKKEGTSHELFKCYYYFAIFNAEQGETANPYISLAIDLANQEGLQELFSEDLADLQRYS